MYLTQSNTIRDFGKQFLGLCRLMLGVAPRRPVRKGECLSLPLCIVYSRCNWRGSLHAKLRSYCWAKLEAEGVLAGGARCARDRRLACAHACRDRRTAVFRDAVSADP